MIICRAPFRVSFFGGGTDYPKWYEVHGGQVLSTTINKYCYVTLRHLPPFFDYKYRIRYYSTEETNSIREIKHPAVRECLNLGGGGKGVELVYQADIPARSGMGSSSTFTVCLLHALASLRGEDLGKRELALEAIRVEQEVLREAVGSQDQVAAAYGGMNHIRFGAEQTFQTQPIALSDEKSAAFWDHIVLVFTHFTRRASDIAEEQVAQIDKKHKQLETMSAMVSEARNLLLDPSPDVRAFGELLHDSWMLKRELSSMISNDEIDEIYRTGCAAGALGGKLLGAGAGGFMLFFVPPGKRPSVLRSLGKLLHVPVKADHDGSQIIFHGNGL